MKKKIAVILAAFGMIGVLAGCESEISTGNVDIQSMAEELQTNLEFEDTMSLIETDVALSYYGIDAEAVDDCVVLISTGATAEEIAIFEAASDDYVEAIQLACETRQNKQTASYADYKPEEVSRLDNAIIETTGRYIIYCVADDNDKAEEIIDSYFK